METHACFRCEKTPVLIKLAVQVESNIVSFQKQVIVRKVKNIFILLE